MRTLLPNYSDLCQLYRAEQLLTALCVVLQRLELKHLSQFAALRTLMHNNAARLENGDDTSGCAGATIETGIGLPATVMNGSEGNERSGW